MVLTVGTTRCSTLFVVGLFYYNLIKSISLGVSKYKNVMKTTKNEPNIQNKTMRSSMIRALDLVRFYVFFINAFYLAIYNTYNKIIFKNV